MIRQLTFLAAFCLLSFITLKANINYRSGWNSKLDNVPALAAPVNVPCPELYIDGFESSFGVWIDGGSNCARVNSFPNTGLWSVELRAGVGITSSMYTPALNFT